jgi:hypothetical protein
MVMLLAAAAKTCALACGIVALVPFVPVAAAPVITMPAAASAGLLQQVNVIDGPDRRNSLLAIGPQLGLSANEIARIRKVSGYVACLEPSPSVGSGALFLSSNQILTAGDIFFDDSGRQRWKCFFKNQDSAPVKIDLLLDPANARLGAWPPKPASNSDYAVVRLAEPITGGDPFPVAPDVPLRAGDALIVVSAHPEAMTTRVDNGIPVVQGCNVRRVPRSTAVTSFYRSDCSASGAMAGAMNLARVDGKLVFRGIIISTGPWRDPKFFGAPYDEAKGSVTTALGADTGILSAGSELAQPFVAFQKPLAAPANATPAPNFPDAANPGRRVALVIGNSAYRNVPVLNNPINDASLIASALKADGFDVTVAANLDRDGLIDALKTFAIRADNADWAVVYFAGHGIEMGGTNYLIPVDAKLLTDRDIELEAVPSGQVIHAIDGAHQLRVVILDACRDNPFTNTMRRTGEGRSIGRGLAKIEPARGTLVFYAAKEGTIAADGDGADSPFATALAKHLTEPGIEVDKMFRLVIDDVIDLTGSKQEPFMYGSLPGRQDFYFRPRS